MRDPIFKGATRPVLWLGVPQIPLLALMLITVLAAMWSMLLVNGFVAFVVLLAAGFVYAILRVVSADDPHRLMQRTKQLESWFHARRSKLTWGAHSATPHDRKPVQVSED